MIYKLFVALLKEGFFGIFEVNVCQSLNSSLRSYLNAYELYYNTRSVAIIKLKVSMI